MIQAYRKTHGNQTPTPAVVRRIIFSSAKNIGPSLIWSAKEATFEQFPFPIG